MPIFVYILLGIALLITLLLISKAKVFVCYKNGDLSVYAKYLFIKLSIIPARPKKVKKKKPTKKRQATVESTPDKEATAKKEKPLPFMLWELRSALLNIINRFMNKLHFKFITLKVNVACDNAAKTALTYAGVSQGISYIIEILRNTSNVEVATHSDICVNADYISQKSEFEGKIVLHLRVTSLIYVGIHALKEYIKFKANKED